MVAAAVALKVAAVVPAATFTDAGTVSEVSLLVSVTPDPPAGAAAFKVTVQFAAALGFRFAGSHTSDEIVETVTFAFVTAETVSQNCRLRQPRLG